MYKKEINAIIVLYSKVSIINLMMAAGSCYFYVVSVSYPWFHRSDDVIVDIWLVSKQGPDAKAGVYLVHIV